MNSSLKELQSRLSNYISNVEKSVAIFTNNYLEIKHGNPDLGIDATLTKVLTSYVIKPDDFCKHAALFFDQVGLNETQVVLIALETLEKEALKHLNIQYQNVIEDDLLVENKHIEFTGKVYIETNKLLLPKEKIYSILNGMGMKYKGKAVSFVVRDNEFWNKIDKGNWSKVFLCHDSSDKDYVKQISFELRKRSIDTWLDEYALKIGDSLTSKITEGINNADFGIIFISKNFLKNEKWVKFELQSLMSQQIYDNQKKILPLWLDIDESDLEEYPWLREKLGANSRSGIEKVIEDLQRAIR